MQLKGYYKDGKTGSVWYDGKNFTKRGNKPVDVSDLDIDRIIETRKDKVADSMNEYFAEFGTTLGEVAQHYGDYTIANKDGITVYQYIRSFIESEPRKVYEVAGRIRSIALAAKDGDTYRNLGEFIENCPAGGFVMATTEDDHLADAENMLNKNFWSSFRPLPTYADDDEPIITI